MSSVLLDLPNRPGWMWYPEEKQVSFLNKADGRLLTFEYLGIEFAVWAPGWVFLLLGPELHDDMPIEN